MQHRNLLKPMTQTDWVPRDTEHVVCDTLPEPCLWKVWVSMWSGEARRSKRHGLCEQGNM